VRFFDLTRPVVENMVTYPGEPGPRFTPVKRIAEGAKADVTKLALGLHTGTHVDAPGHVLPGSGGLERYPLDALCGPARVVAIAHPSSIEVGELERAGLDGVTRVLFRTRNSVELWSEEPVFREDYVSLSPEGAAWLAARGARLVGIDYLSLEKFGSPSPRAHANLLVKGCAIVEGLDLRAVPPGDYEVFCLPLRLIGTDGAPARVILRAA
jgi:arylformamidase